MYAAIRCVEQSAQGGGGAIAGPLLRTVGAGSLLLSLISGARGKMCGEGCVEEVGRCGDGVAGVITRPPGGGGGGSGRPSSHRPRAFAARSHGALLSLCFPLV